MKTICLAVLIFPLFLIGCKSKDNHPEPLSVLKDTIQTDTSIDTIFTEELEVAEPDSEIIELHTITVDVVTDTGEDTNSHRVVPDWYVVSTDPYPSWRDYEGIDPTIIHVPLFQTSISETVSQLGKYFSVEDYNWGAYDYRLIPDFSDVPEHYNINIGFHDPSSGCYFRGNFLQYNLDIVGEDIGERDEINLYGLFSIDSIVFSKVQEYNTLSPQQVKRTSRKYIAWKPDEKWQDGDSEYHPAKFDSIRRLARLEIDTPDVSGFTWLHDSLKNRGLQTDSTLDSLQYIVGCAGDDAGRIDYYQLHFNTRSDSLICRHKMIVQRTDSKYRIVTIRTEFKLPVTRPGNKGNLRSFNWQDVQLWEEKMGKFLHIGRKHKVFLLGPVDLQFDGVYEIVVNTASYINRGAPGLYDIVYKVFDCSDVTIKTVGHREHISNF